MSSEDSNNECKCICYTHLEYTLILYLAEENASSESSPTPPEASACERSPDEIDAGCADMLEAFLDSIKAKEYNLNAKNLCIGLTVHDARSQKGVSKLPMIVTLQQHLGAIEGSTSLTNYFEILAEFYYPSKYLGGKRYGQMWIQELAADEANGVPFEPLSDIGTTTYNGTNSTTNFLLLFSTFVISSQPQSLSLRKY
jgi:di/tripeptidase